MCGQGGGGRSRQALARHVPVPHPSSSTPGASARGAPPASRCWHHRYWLLAPPLPAGTQLGTGRTWGMQGESGRGTHAMCSLLGRCVQSQAHRPTRYHTGVAVPRPTRQPRVLVAAARPVAMTTHTHAHNIHEQGEKGGRGIRVTQEREEPMRGPERQHRGVKPQRRLAHTWPMPVQPCHDVMHHEHRRSRQHCRHTTQGCETSRQHDSSPSADST